MSGYRIHCPFCGRDDIPQYVLPTAEHRIIAQWMPRPREMCRFLECKPEVGERTAKWWNDERGCACSEPWKDCEIYQAKHPKAIEERASEIVHD